VALPRDPVVGTERRDLSPLVMGPQAASRQRVLSGGTEIGANLRKVQNNDEVRCP
jgi:hypothetical protein